MHGYFNISKDILVRITVKRIMLFKHDIDSKMQKGKYWFLQHLIIILMSYYGNSQIKRSPMGQRNVVF